MSAPIVDLAESLQKDPQLSDDMLNQMIAYTDPASLKFFLGSDKEVAKAAVKNICCILVEKHLNVPTQELEALRRKTRILLVMNNFALHKPLRAVVFHAVKTLDSMLEDSMKKEGTLPFDSELGRMSEHMLVLLMRVCEYKLKAIQVHEFAENNTQFAVQLLLAILLKEPPYEFELRCNCISGLLGFTQPQAFFSASEPIEFHECTQFSEKIHFIQDLMLRLSAVQVINDVVAPNLIQSPTVVPLVHFAVVNTMRCVMNIFHYSKNGDLQWRQHILLSTNFIDGTTILYLDAQVRSFESFASMTPTLPSELLPGIITALRFMAFATFHMGSHARSLRPICSFLDAFLKLPVRTFMTGTYAAQLQMVYTQLLRVMCNMDVLAGDDDLAVEPEDLPEELTCAALKHNLSFFLLSEFASCGGNVLETLENRFISMDSDALVAEDCLTFTEIQSIFASLRQQQPSATAAATAPSTKKLDSSKLLGDMPTLHRGGSEKKVAVKGPVQIEQRFVMPATKKKAPESTSSVNPRFACALNGHLMKNPVSTPYGHTFEKETIEQWLRQQGSVCPITGKPLSLEDLKPNKELASEIMALVVQESMTMENDEDTRNLYDF